MINFYEQCWDNNNEAGCFKIENNINLSHFHSAFEFIYVEKGRLNAVINNKQYTVMENQLIIVPSYHMHSYNSFDGTNTIVLIVPLSLMSIFENIFKQKVFSQYIYNGEDINEIYHCINRIIYANKTSKSLIAVSYINLIISILINDVPMEQIVSQRIHGKIQNILKYIEENYKYDISVSSVAKEFSLSKSRLSHLFNEHMGYTFPDFIGTLRVMNAAFLIRNENCTVTQAAMDSGFNSMNTFYRTFERHFGIAPSKYKCSK